jgi:hypothetical protein
VLLPPADIVALLSSFAPLFSRRIWRHVPLLVVGAILAPGRRMVSSVLRAVGLSQEQHFQTYHRGCVRREKLSRDTLTERKFWRFVLEGISSMASPVYPSDSLRRRVGAAVWADGVAGITRTPCWPSLTHAAPRAAPAVVSAAAHRATRSLPD